MVNVKDFNAAGDGITNDTGAVQEALDTGKIVCFPAGTYLCGSLYMRSHGGIYLEEGATLLAIPGKENYNADNFSCRNMVFAEEHTSGAHFIIAEDCENISISGKGKISGNYLSVFDNEKVAASYRPHYEYPAWRMSQMIFIAGCKNVKITDVTMSDPQYWTCFLLDCEDVCIANITLRADRLVMNSDGLDIDCCRRVVIANCNIDCGDDCIAIRANESQSGHYAPCQNVIVRNCKLRCPACAVRIGVGNGTLKDVILQNLNISDSTIGIGICPSYNRTKCVDIDNVLVENITMEVNQALIITPEWGYLNKTEDAPVIKPLRNITFRNIKANSYRGSLFVFPVRSELYSGIMMEKVQIHLKEPSLPLPPHRWPQEEYGVLNILRGSVLDVSGFIGTSDGDLPEIMYGKFPEQNG